MINNYFYTCNLCSLLCFSCLKCNRLSDNESQDKLINNALLKLCNL